MNYSYELITELKRKLELKSDNETSKVLPKSTSGTISEIKSGKRTLTEEQALFICEMCNLNVDWVLVHLAQESAKSPVAKSAWLRLGKTLAKTVNALAIIGIVLFSEASPPNRPERIRNVP